VAFAAALSLGLATLAVASVPAALREDFAKYATERCVRDHRRFGPWSVRSTGFGCVKVVSDAEGRRLSAESIPSTERGETHSILVTGPVFAPPLSYSLRVRTLKQTRTGSPPNEWETAWIVWGYSDPEHFYYFVPRPGGWELGKRDPAYKGGQRFLASGKEPSFPLGGWAEIRVAQDGDGRIEVWAGPRRVAKFVDEERPYSAGKIGFYGEDCAAEFAGVRASAGRP
jgi:hypothetical protein